ncbi:uncharacterized protein LOC131210625 [Anopheles bellator]|uniref:uncharacterized protein LOC131210625 n=1 Tax=Anopheles bellator TaxID=139047 RepID=UPI00264A2BFD|nr:uncharacterized protein LOC131210625 [Anopheles bellator]
MGETKLAQSNSLPKLAISKPQPDGGETPTGTTVANASAEDHYDPSVRILHIPRQNDGSCGFHLTRSKWDPYPWVSGVDADSPAEVTGLKVGDCVLEVNNEDVLGMRIAEVAALVRAKADIVTLLLWSTGMEPACNPESLCCGPMPINLERLTASMQTIVAALECPVCFDTIPPPVFQCQNGHLVCSRCRVRADRCAICRERYTLGRSLLAEQVFQSITEAFNLSEGSDGRLRERLFGARCSRRAPPPAGTKRSPFNSDGQLTAVSGRPIHSHTHKFLARIMGKASSVDNLTKPQPPPPDVVGDLQTAKGKSLSLSSSDIFKRDNSVSVLRCPSANRLAPELSASYNSLTVRRPTSSMSCNASAESLSSIPEHGIQLTVPATLPSAGSDTPEAPYHCPCGEYCSDLITALELHEHVTVHHRTPVISFGTASAEISLPPRTPVDNACLLLVLDGHKFWLKLISDTSTVGDIFLSALLEGGPEQAKNYALEVIIRKEGFDQILGKELISRSEVHSMVDKSWNDLINTKAGVFYTGVCIRATFSPDTEILLKVSVKRLADL